MPRAARASSSAVPARRPGPGRRARLRGADLGRQIEQQADDLTAGDAVDDGVMNLRVQGDVARFQAGDDVHLPQRPGPVERPRMQPRHLLRQLPVVSGGGQSQIAHVELEVEVLVLHPVREIHAERHLEQPPAQDGQQMHAVGKQPHHDVDVQLLEGSRARVVDAEAADVPRLPPVLDRQELSVEAGELSHAGVLGRSSRSQECELPRICPHSSIPQRCTGFPGDVSRMRRGRASGTDHERPSLLPWRRPSRVRRRTIMTETIKTLTMTRPPTLSHAERCDTNNPISPSEMTKVSSRRSLPIC